MPPNRETDEFRRGEARRGLQVGARVGFIAVRVFRHHSSQMDSQTDDTTMNNQDPSEMEVDIQQQVRTSSERQRFDPDLTDSQDESVDNMIRSMVIPEEEEPAPSTSTSSPPVEPPPPQMSVEEYRRIFGGWRYPDFLPEVLTEEVRHLVEVEDEDSDETDVEETDWDAI